MVINGDVYYRKAIILNEENIRQIIELAQKYCDKIRLEITTKRKSRIAFDSIDEFFKYDNFGKNRIDELFIYGYDGYSRVISIEFSTGFFPSYLLGYGKTADCNYSFNKQQDESLFVIELQKILKKCKAPYWVLSKITLSGLLFFSCLIISLIGFLLQGFPHNRESTPLTTLLSIAIALIILSTAFVIDRFGLKNFFPPIVFAIGDGKIKFEKYKNLRTNIFWVIIVGILVGALTTWIYNLIFK